MHIWWVVEWLCIQHYTYIELTVLTAFTGRNIYVTLWFIPAIELTCEPTSFLAFTFSHLFTRLDFHLFWKFIFHLTSHPSFFMCILRDESTLSEDTEGEGTEYTGSRHTIWRLLGYYNTLSSNYLKARKTFCHSPFLSLCLMSDWIILSVCLW